MAKEKILSFVEARANLSEVVEQARPDLRYRQEGKTGGRHHRI